MSPAKTQVSAKNMVMAGELKRSLTVVFLRDLLHFVVPDSAKSVSGSSFLHLYLTNRDMTTRYTITLKMRTTPAGTAKVARNIGNELMKQLKRERGICSTRSENVRCLRKCQL